MRQLLTGTLPEAKKPALRAQLQAAGYDPDIIEDVAKSPMDGREVDRLISYGILGKPGNIVQELAKWARGADGDAKLARFAQAANDNNKTPDEIRSLLEQAYREAGMPPEQATDAAMGVLVRSRLAESPSAQEVATSVRLTLGQTATPPQIHRILSRLAEQGVIAKEDIPRIGLETMRQIREAAAPPVVSPADLARAIRQSSAEAPEAVRALRSALTDSRIPAAKAVEAMVSACGGRADRDTYEGLMAAITAQEHYPIGRRNALMDALGARMLRPGMERAGADGSARMSAVTDILGSAPDGARLRGALDELRRQGVADNTAVGDILGRLQRGEELLRNRQGLGKLREFMDAIAKFGAERVDDCLDQTKPLVIEGQKISAETIAGLLDGSIAAPDPERTRRIVAELQARTPLGRIRGMLADDRLSVTRELLGGGNLRTDTRIYTIAEINAALEGK